MITASRHGAVAIFAVDATIDADVGSMLAQRVEELPVGGRPQVVLDLTAAPLIDSAGCEALLDVQDLLRRSGGAASLAAVAPLCRDILVATGVGDAFEEFDTVNEAVASYAR